MSACLLSLSVISLVLPVSLHIVTIALVDIRLTNVRQTAFHASFRNQDEADAQSLRISRGTSVVCRLAQKVSQINLLINVKDLASRLCGLPLIPA
jgi:Ca2+:H+ antiporter